MRRQEGSIKKLSRLFIMGIIMGPNIVTDGLVFGYDADDRSTRFYPGEPTTNIYPRSAPYFSSAYNGTNYGFGAGTDLQQVIDNTLYTKSKSDITKVSRIVGGTEQSDYINISLSSPIDSVRTVSFWYYGTVGTIIRPNNYYSFLSFIICFSIVV